MGRTPRGSSTLPRRNSPRRSTQSGSVSAGVRARGQPQLAEGARRPRESGLLGPWKCRRAMPSTGVVGLRMMAGALRAERAGSGWGGVEHRDGVDALAAAWCSRLGCSAKRVELADGGATHPGVLPSAARPRASLGGRDGRPSCADLIRLDNERQIQKRVLPPCPDPVALGGARFGDVPLASAAAGVGLMCQVLWLRGSGDLPMQSGVSGVERANLPGLQEQRQ